MRSSLRAVLSGLSAERHKQAETLLLTHLAADKRFLSAARLMLYCAMPTEVPTKAVLERWSGEKELFLPVIEQGELLVKPYEGDDQMRQGLFGIWEPTTSTFEDITSIDYILVPGVGFDRQKHRLGHGKAYYDRFLSLLDLERTHCVGVAFAEQILPEIPTEAHDITLHDLIIV